MAESKSKALSKVMCTFGGDAQVRQLFATQLSLGRAFILSLEPPALGSEVKMVFQPAGRRPIPEIVGRVIAARLDPAADAGSGFEVVFPKLSQEQLVALAGISSDRPKGAAGAPLPDLDQANLERRRHPRVVVDAAATLAPLDGGSQFAGRTTDLSMGGALITLEGALVPERGTAVTATFTAAGVEPLEVNAVIARVVGGSSPAVGLQFKDVDRYVAMRLEEVLLAAMTAS